jgi:DNA-binding response OmpR family regulator
MSGPTVLIVMASHWPRALLRAALREAGYDAIGTSTLKEALAFSAGEGGRVGLIVLDHTVVNSRDYPLLADLLDRHPHALTLKLESATHRSKSKAWSHVLRRPVSIAEIVRIIQSLLPAPNSADTQLDSGPAGDQRRESQP